MRWCLILLALIPVACSQAGGGAANAPAPPAPPDDAIMNAPGLPSGNNSFSPNNTPTTQGGRYYGYD